MHRRLFHNFFSIPLILLVVWKKNLWNKRLWYNGTSIWYRINKAMILSLLHTHARTDVEGALGATLPHIIIFRVQDEIRCVIQFYMYNTLFQKVCTNLARYDGRFGCLWHLWHKRRKQLQKKGRGGGTQNSLRSNFQLSMPTLRLSMKKMRWGRAAKPLSRIPLPNQTPLCDKIHSPTPSPASATVALILFKLLSYCKFWITGWVLIQNLRYDNCNWILYLHPSRKFKMTFTCIRSCLGW